MLKRIKLLGTEEDLDNGFYVIMTSGEGATCLRDENYIVNEKVIELLNKNNIKFRKEKLHSKSA